MTRILGLVPLLVVALPLACLPPGRGVPENASPTDVAFLRILDRHDDAVRAGDAARVAALYTADGVIMPSDGPTLVGRSMIATHLRTAYAGGRVPVLERIVDDVHATRDRAAVRFRLTMATESLKGGDRVTLPLRGVFALRREAGGDWRIESLVYSPDPARPAMQAGQPVTQGGGPARATARIRERSAQLTAAEARGDVEASVALFATDAVVHPPGAPAIVGRDGVRAFYTKGFPLPLVAFTSTTTFVEVAPAGGLAVETGVNRFTFRAPTGEVVDVGKYLATWREVAGDWYVALLSFSSDREPRAPEPMPAPSAAVDVVLRDEMERHAHHWRQGNVSALAQQFTEDASVLLPGGDALRGRARIEAMFRESLAADSVLALTATTEETGGLGNEAYSLGRYAETLQPRKGGPSRVQGGRFLVLWARGSDGAWRMRRFVAQLAPE